MRTPTISGTGTPERGGVRLFRRFLFTAAASLAAILLIAGLGQRMVFRKLAVAEAERVAQQIGMALRTIALDKFLEEGPLGARGLTLPQDEARLLDRRLRGFLSAFEVFELHVLTHEGTVVYSTDGSLIGKSGNLSGNLPARPPKSPHSRLIHLDSARTLDGTWKSDVDVVDTRLPIYAEDGSRVGSFSIRHDVSAALALSDRFIGMATLELFLVVLAVFTGFGSLMYLSEQRLRGAQEEAVRANQAKSQFLANMSHELRSPLHGVLGMVNLLRETPLGPVQQEYVEALQTSSETLLSVINDILDFSKIEAGKLELEIRDLDLHACMEELVDVYAVPAADKGLDLVLSQDPALPRWIRGDMGRIKQILGNLLDNAIKFTSEGRVLLAADWDKQEGRVEFRVADTGIGIDPESLKQLFRPFVQAEASTTRRFGGSGLGLSISRQLAEMMGGTVEARSEAGRGATFRFLLPVGSGAAASPRVGVRKIEPAGRILVAESDDIRRRALERTLESWGWRPTLVGDPSSLREVLDTSPASGEGWDVLLLDPEMDGEPGWLEDAGRGADGRRTRLIGLVTIGWRARTDAAIQALFTSVLTKPVKPSALRSALQAKEAPGLRSERVEDVRTSEPAGIKGEILVVEDNAVNRMVAAGLLRNMGYRPTLAESGSEALELLKVRDFDAVLMDIQMPGMDGVETTRQIRKFGRRAARDVPVIAMTAHAMKGDREKFLAAGMEDYVAKPVRPQDLAHCLEQAVGDRFPKTGAQAVGLDLGNLRGMFDGKPEMVRHLAWEAMEESRRLVGEMREALGRRDISTFSRAAHDLKSSLGYLCNGPGRRLASELELMGRQQDASRAETILVQMTRAMSRIEQDLQEQEGEPQ